MQWTRTKLDDTSDEIREALGRLSELFNEDMRIGFIAWHPDYPERSLFVGDEPLNEAADAILFLKNRSDLNR